MVEVVGEDQVDVVGRLDRAAGGGVADVDDLGAVVGDRDDALAVRIAAVIDLVGREHLHRQARQAVAPGGDVGGVGLVAQDHVLGLQLGDGAPALAQLGAQRGELVLEQHVVAAELGSRTCAAAQQGSDDHDEESEAAHDAAIVAGAIRGGQESARAGRGAIEVLREALARRARPRARATLPATSRVRTRASRPSLATSRRLRGSVTLRHLTVAKELSMRTILASLVLLVTVVLAAPAARAECNCLAIAGEVSARIQGSVARADSLHARGDLAGALTLYADAYRASEEPPLLFAQGMCQWQLGAAREARALFTAYLDAGDALPFAARAEAALAALGDDDRGVVGGVVGGVGGVVGGVVGGARAGGAAGGAVVGGVAGDLRGQAPKPKKLAKGAAILLGVVAVVAVGAVAVQGISAGLKDDVDFDRRFGLGMGLSGAVVGGTAIYLWGLTAATGAVGASCLADAPAAPLPRAMVAPVAYHGGGGVAGAFTF